ncbi:hypothetical protein OXX59_008892 [Metschnikowia pulcherrima]
MSRVVTRSLATTSGASKSAFQVFDRAAKRVQRSKTPKTDVFASRKADFLRDEVSLRTIERLAFITRDFTRTLDLGAHSGNLLKNLCTVSRAEEGADETEVEMIKQLNADKQSISPKMKELVMLDSSRAFDAPELAESEQFDTVISNLSLHWINDLPQALANINRVLKPDGLFMGTIFGGDTLYELRTSLQLAELERLGGMSPRVSPLVHLNDVGSLLNRAGFSMLTIDTEDIVVGGYPDLVAMCTDLQHMGEQNSLLARAHTLPRDVLLAANEICKSLHGESGPDGITIPATFNVIFMIGWKKSDTQPQPLARGSGQVNLKDVLEES